MSVVLRTLKSRRSLASFLLTVLRERKELEVSHGCMVFSTQGYCQVWREKGYLR